MFFVIILLDCFILCLEHYITDPDTDHAGLLFCDSQLLC